MKQRSQKNVKRRLGESTRTPLATPDPTSKPKWIDGQALFFISLIGFIGLSSILFPLSFYLFSFNYQSSLPIPVQALWTLAAIGALVLVSKPTTFSIPGLAVYAVAAAGIFSFFALRTTYPTLICDAGSGALPQHFIIPLDPHHRHLGEFLTLQLSKIVPRSIHFFYHRAVLFDNELSNNTWIVMTLIFAIATVVLFTLVLRRMNLANNDRFGLLLFLMSSAPMLNGYGGFYNYIVSIFSIALCFIYLWLLHRTPTRWTLYAVFPLLCLLCVFAHPVLWPLPGFMLLMLFFIFLQSRGRSVPRWLIAAGAIAVGCAPLIFLHSSADPYLMNLRFDDTFGLHIYTRLLCCLEVSSPALVLTGLVIWKNPAILRHPTPLQAVALAALISNVLLFFTCLLEMAITVNLSYSQYGAIIYGCAIILYLSAPPAPRSLLHSAILGLFLFLPAVYVHSGSLLFERQLKLYPQDRSSTTYQVWGPYLKLGLGVPIDTPENRRRKLDAFKAGVTTTIPDWQQFRGLNMLYYTAWCFEFGECDEGTQCLIQVFDQPQALQDLWHSGTRFTAWNENKAYRRIRQASRNIIRDGLRKNPANRYLQQLSAALDEYDRRDP